MDDEPDLLLLKFSEAHILALTPKPEQPPARLSKPLRWIGV